jgi:hypothetical protein
LAYNFSRSMVGGDIGGLLGLADNLSGYVPQMESVSDALNVAARILEEVVTMVAANVSGLAADLRTVEDVLEQAADEARAAGVPVAAPDGVRDRA